MQISYDIVIVGGGIVGLTLACALAQETQLKIAILDQQKKYPDWSLENYFPRVSAVALSSQQIFKSLQIWDTLQNARVSAFNRIHVKDFAGDEIFFTSQEIAQAQLGFIIENNLIQLMLERKLLTHPNVKIFPGVKLAAMAEENNQVYLTAEDDRTWVGKLAVAADGMCSSLREKAGISVATKDYQQEAIVTHIQTSSSHHKTARQIFLKTGPLAFLPLFDTHQCSIVWSLPTTHAQHLMQLDDLNFKKELNQNIFACLGEVIDISKRFSFSLASQHAKKYFNSRVVLVGDAAHTVHPLAGQGLNMGLLDAASLAELLVEALQKGRDFSSSPVLRRYERWRRADHLLMFKGIDFLQSFFGQEKKLIQSWRSSGLYLTSQFSLLKKFFITYAVGRRRGLPKLAIPPLHF